jgi:hypothetical protein
VSADVEVEVLNSSRLVLSVVKMVRVDGDREARRVAASQFITTGLGIDPSGFRLKEYRCPGQRARVDPDPVAGVNDAIYSRLLSVVRTAGTTGATNSNVLACSWATIS